MYCTGAYFNNNNYITCTNANKAAISKKQRKSNKGFKQINKNICSKQRKSTKSRKQINKTKTHPLTKKKTIAPPPPNNSQTQNLINDIFNRKAIPKPCIYHQRFGTATNPAQCIQPCNFTSPPTFKQLASQNRLEKELVHILSNLSDKDGD